MAGWLHRFTRAFITEALANRKINMKFQYLLYDEDKVRERGVLQEKEKKRGRVC